MCNIMTVKEVIKQYEGKFDEKEIYEYNSIKFPKLHTDCIRGLYGDTWDSVVSISDIEDFQVDSYYLMDEDEYNTTIQANSMYIDFNDIYGNPNAKVLVIMVSPEIQL